MGWHDVEVSSIPPLRGGAVYMTVPDLWANYQGFLLFYVPSPPVFVYCRGLFQSGGNDCRQVTAVAKMENLAMAFASFFAACKYGHVYHSFGYTQFDNHGSGFILPLQPSFVEDVGGVGLARLITICGSHHVMSLLVLKRDSEIRRGRYIGDELPCLGHEFETGAISDTVATRATNFQKEDCSVVLDIPAVR